jgi:hypothetical protein
MKKTMRSVVAHAALKKISVKLTSAQRLVLRALADYANADFECHPGRRALASSSGLSVRQVIRILRQLRAVKLIDFEDNKGGSRCDTNHYRLLFARVTTGDNLSLPRVTDSSSTGDKSSETGDKSSRDYALTGDIAVTPESLDLKSLDQSLRTQSNNYPSPTPPQGEGFVDALQNLRTRDLWEAAGEIDDDEGVDLAQLMAKIQSGTPITREEKCSKHGPFLRKGFRFDNWLAWNGRESMFSSDRSDEGCAGCKDDEERWDKEHPEGAQRRAEFAHTLPILTFELESPAICRRHGALTIEAVLHEYGEVWIQAKQPRFRLMQRYMCWCPGCEAECIYEMQVQEDLGLSNEQWERGGTQILAAIASAHQGA